MPKVETRTLKDGQTRRYYVRFTHPHTGRQTSRVFAVKREAEAFARNLERLGTVRTLAEIDESQAQKAIPTLDEWAAVHVAALTKVTPGTRKGYERMYARVWAPRLGHMRLNQIEHEDVALAVNDYAQTITGKGHARNLVSDKTVANAHGLLAAMMRSAIRKGHMTKDPCADIQLPDRTGHTRIEARFLTHDEFKRLHDVLPEHYRPFYVFLAGTGCRWGEAVALDVGDVDLDLATVRITKSEKYDPSKSRWEIGPPKTKRSRRTITLPADLVSMLAPLIEGRKRTERLFTAPRGGPMRHRRVWSEVWRPAVKKAGLEPEPRQHDLRHSHVAWLIAAGIPLPVIQARLGHEHIETTIGTYGHLLPDLQNAAARAADAALGGLNIAQITDGASSGQR
jgi:integrase